MDVTVIRAGIAGIQGCADGIHGPALLALTNARDREQACALLHRLEPELPEAVLVAALNVRAALAELPSFPTRVAVDLPSLAEARRMPFVDFAYEVGCASESGARLLVLGDGNACHDIAIAEGERLAFLSRCPRLQGLLNPAAARLLVLRRSLLTELISLVGALGLPFSPRFYMSLADWWLEPLDSDAPDPG